MKNYVNYTWLFPLLGGILALIAFFTPAAYYRTVLDYLYIWIWGLASYQYYDPYDYSFDKGIFFVNTPNTIIPSIICSIPIAVCIMLLIGSSIFYRKRLRNSNVNPVIWIIASIGIIGFTAGYMIAYELLWPSDLPNFWSYMNAGFGVIGMFLGGPLSLVGYIVVKVGHKRQGEVISVPAKEIPTTRIVPDISSGIPTPVKFCPECGQQVKGATQRFCMNCGFEFEKL